MSFVPASAAPLKGSCFPEGVGTIEKQTALFPYVAPSAAFSVHDLAYAQGLLQNESNYAAETICDVFEIAASGVGRWLRGLHDAELRNYLLTSSSGAENIATRILFLGHEPQPNTSFGCQVSISQTMMEEIMRTVQVSPHFVEGLLGQYTGNHIPPAEFSTYDEAGILERLEFIYQQPRWGFRERQFPISVYMTYDCKASISTYIMTAENTDTRLHRIQDRLTDTFVGESPLPAAILNASDPFLFHCLVTHVNFMNSDKNVFDLGKRLYSALDQVDAYAETQIERDTLRALNFQLHQLSQDADAMIMSAEIGLVGIECMMSAQRRVRMTATPNQISWLAHSLNTAKSLERALEARKRWLLSSKSRKDTAMTLVYNLVTQKDFETNLAIAHDTKNDSSSMKTIALLTMIFLPASTVSSVFGMSFFDISSDVFVVNRSLWLFPVVTIPVTILVFIFWWLWQNSADIFLFDRARKEPTSSWHHRSRLMLSKTLFKSSKIDVEKGYGSAKSGE